MPLIEELPLKTATRITPGWALVPETQPITALEPGKRSRGTARDGHRTAGGGITAKQAKAAEARLAKLEKENHQDVSIPLPAAARSRERSRKMTSNVRRILTYQRNFQHYLADELALAQAGGAGVVSTAAPTQPGGSRRRESGITGTAGGSSRRTSAQQQQLTMHPPPRPKSANASSTSQTSTPVKREPPSSSASTPAPAPPSASKADTTDPLLRTLNLPKPPTARVMAALVAEPALSYNAARAMVDEAALQNSKPTRHFCGNCGYWGKVRCRACGAGRTCGLLECYKAHREVCEGLLR